MKPESLYNNGMRPLMYSRTEAERSNIGWQRMGENICYFQNTTKRKAGGAFYTLSFTVTFRHDNDDVYFAHCYPYTYSDCQKYLNKICTIANKDRIRKTTLCKTLAGNDCDMVIITNFYSTPEAISMRKAIVLSA